MILLDESSSKRPTIPLESLVELQLSCCRDMKPRLRHPMARTSTNPRIEAGVLMTVMTLTMVKHHGRSELPLRENMVLVVVAAEPC
jgi:hypothetical protein